MVEPGKNNIKTRDVLLNVAEELFSKHGYDGISVRDITEQAGTRLAAINYHFETKQKLYDDVILRRAHILSSDRLLMLNAIDLEQLDAKNKLKELAQAFIYPLLTRSTGKEKGWKNYCRLIAQVAALNHSFPKAIIEAFNPPAIEFIGVLKQILPELSDREAQYAFQFMLGTTLYMFTYNSRLKGLSDGNYSSKHMKTIYPDMVKYIVGGLLNITDNKTKT